MTTSDKATELLEDLARGVEQLTTSDDWLAFLACQAKFYNYSANNQLLIWHQAPHATRVAGYQAWRKDHGRQVRKGERGIRILAPCVRKVRDDETGQDRRIVTGFRVTSVFDVSQTDGEPLAELPIELVTGDDADQVGQRLAELVHAAGYRTEITPGALPEHALANGVTNHAAALVKVRGDLPPAQQAKTMAHELAHVLIHQPGDPDRPTSRAIVEVEAESVAYVVLAVMGIASDGYSVPYVASWSGGDPDVIRGTAERVSKAVKSVLADLEPPAENQRTLAALAALAGPSLDAQVA